MFAEKPRLARAIRYALGTAIGVSTSLSGATAFAQEPGAKPVEEIYVTGSRIGRTSDFESPSPVASFDRADLNKAGYNNLQQLMEKQPFTGNGTFSTRGNNQDSTANGAASISLRGLGADATLVLVNGRRVAISAFAESITTNFVDINSIPVAAIERIEVLKDGASAVYGSDAVAGVVNIILRDDFEGAELSAGGGWTTESGYDETNVSGIWGVSGENSNITLIADYFKNSTLANPERHNADGGSLGSANHAAEGGFDLRSSRGFPGFFIVSDGILEDPDGAGPELPADAKAVVDPSCPADRITGSQACVFDYGPFNLITPEAERTGLLVLGHQGFGNGLEVFTEIAVQHNKSLAAGAPTPLDETAGLTVPVDHPGNPFAGATDIDIGRFRTVDAGARTWHIETDNLRGVLGLRGDLNDWNWEVSAQRARSETEQSGDRSDGWIRTDFLQNEINAFRYNPFNTTINPQSVIDAIATSVVRRGKSDMTSYDASLTGALFDMPAGPVQMATGVEYREEAISDVPDDQFQRGLIFGTEAVSAAASRDLWSAYVEFSVPLLESLELSLAGRYDDYSDFGDTTNPKVAVRWAPIDALAFRASWGTGFRAPSLAQIGLGPSQESQFFKDTYACIDQGIDPNSTACPSLDYTIIFSGNPDLNPEESETLNVGVAWQPSDMWRISVDYWDILQEDKIDEVPFGFIYDQNCNDQTSTVCVRGTPVGSNTLGPLAQLNSGFVNIGEQSVTGIDLGAHFASSLGAGVLTLGLEYSHLLEFERVELNSDASGFVTRDLTGEYEYPEDRFVLSGDWTMDAWGLFASVNYIGSFQDAPDADLDGTLDFDTVTTRDVDAFVTLNLQANYTGFEGLTLSLGVENALDEEVPFAIGDGDTDVYGYVQNVHSPRGRFAYGKLTYRFE
jgi:outer membrane receptor protein involved in Fe transport